MHGVGASNSIMCFLCVNVLFIVLYEIKKSKKKAL